MTKDLELLRKINEEDADNTTLHFKPTEDTLIDPEVHVLSTAEDNFRGDIELAKSKKKSDKWTPTDEDKELIRAFVSEKTWNGKLDYDLAEMLFMWCKNFPEEVEAYEKGELKLENIENVHANKMLKENRFVYKLTDEDEKELQKKIEMANKKYILST